MKNTLITMLTVVNFLVKDVETYFDITFHRKEQVITNQPGNVTISFSVLQRTKYFNESQGIKPAHQPAIRRFVNISPAEKLADGLKTKSSCKELFG